MKLSKRLYFLKFTIAYVIGSFLIALIINWIQYDKIDMSNTAMFFTAIFFTAYLSGLYGNFFFRYFASKSQKEISRKIIPAFLLFWLGAIIIATIVLGVTKNIWNYRSVSSFIELQDFLFAFKALFPWIFVLSIIFFYILWVKGVNREHNLNQELLKFKYQTLKTQVNPHFLFNSLNALVSLIHSDPNKAEIFTTKLSDVYRYILINENNKLVPLSEEISFVKDYFDLQKIRDGEKINLEMKLENIDNYQIVPVSLQVLVENAIKHNSASASKPLKILIEQIKDHIQVSNNLQRKISMQDSSGTGLINLKERVKLVVNREVKITETQNDFVVQIPLKEM